MKYEVVITEHGLDVGLMTEESFQGLPKKVIARFSEYDIMQGRTYCKNEPEYGGVESLRWIRTGVYMTKKDWFNASFDKSTDQILSNIGIQCFREGKGNCIINNNGKIIINGEEMPECPAAGNNVTVIGSDVYMNGYELIGGKWKRTLSALWHKWF